uniref:RWD domain-containing protein n=1 Tax=Macrostomum lignano TaxID=282301 RepID=A0A1I8FQF6_9PLAT
MKLSDEAEQELAQVESVLKPLPKCETGGAAGHHAQISGELLRQEDADPALPTYAEGYPASRLKLTDGLAQLAEGRGHEKATGAAGRPARLPCVHNWLRDNPLCSAAEEIAEIKSRLLDKQEGDRLKLLQAESRLTAAKAGYRLSLQLTLPNDYPESRAEAVRPPPLRHLPPPSASSRRATPWQGQEALRQQARPGSPRPACCPLARLSASRLPAAQLRPTTAAAPSADQAAAFGDCGRGDGDGVFGRGPPPTSSWSSWLRPFVSRPALSEGEAAYMFATSHDVQAGVPDGKPCGMLAAGSRSVTSASRTSAKVLESAGPPKQAKERELAEVADFFNLSG